MESYRHREVLDATAALFLTASVLALVFGLGFLLAPATILPMYGVSTDGSTILMSRFFGGALVNLGLAYYLLRDVREPSTVRALALAGFVGSGCGAVVALRGVQTGTTNSLGWSTVGIYLVLALAYASCLRTRPA